MRERERASARARERERQEAVEGMEAQTGLSEPERDGGTDRPLGAREGMEAQTGLSEPELSLYGGTDRPLGALSLAPQH
jgi:hypothetical protein